MKSRSPSLDSDERRRRRNLEWFLAAASERGDRAWDSDPVEIADFLRKANEKFGWEIPIDMDKIRKQLKEGDDRVKEKSELYQKQLKINRRKRDGKKRKKNKKIMSKKWRLPSSSSPPSTITAEEENHRQSTHMIQENTNRGTREAPLLVITRRLCATDMGDQQQRLSIPIKQVKNDSFLTEKERWDLNHGIWVKARLRVPCGEGKDRKYDVHMRLSQAGPNGKCYAIGKPWNQIKTENGFQVGTTLNVLAYRGKEGKLKLILDRLLN